MSNNYKKISDRNEKKQIIHSQRLRNIISAQILNPVNPSRNEADDAYNGVVSVPSLYTTCTVSPAAQISQKTKEIEPCLKIQNDLGIYMSTSKSII